MKDSCASVVDLINLMDALVDFREKKSSIFS
jgi:hypothetical protein